MFKWILPFIVYLILSPEFFRKALASSIFVPDSDTALLFQLVTTTASQLNELEQLVTSAQKAHRANGKRITKLPKTTTLGPKRITLHRSVLY